MEEELQLECGHTETSGWQPRYRESYWCRKCQKDKKIVAIDGLPVGE